MEICSTCLFSRYFVINQLKLKISKNNKLFFFLSRKRYVCNGFVTAGCIYFTTKSVKENYEQNVVVIVNTLHTLSCTTVMNGQQLQDQLNRNMPEWTEPALPTSQSHQVDLSGNREQLMAVTQCLIKFIASPSKPILCTGVQEMQRLTLELENLVK